MFSVARRSVAQSVARAAAKPSPVLARSFTVSAAKRADKAPVIQGEGGKGACMAAGQQVGDAAARRMR